MTSPARDFRGYGRQPPHAQWPGDATGIEDRSLCNTMAALCARAALARGARPIPRAPRAIDERPQLEFD